MDVVKRPSNNSPGVRWMWLNGRLTTDIHRTDVCEFCFQDDEDYPLCQEGDASEAVAAGQCTLKEPYSHGGFIVGSGFNENMSPAAVLCFVPR